MDDYTAMWHHSLKRMQKMCHMVKAKLIKSVTSRVYVLRLEEDFADILHSIFFSIEIQLKFVPKVQLTVSIV